MDDTGEKHLATARARYPLWAREQIRYTDVDRSDHVNNAAFAAYFETARVQYLRDEALALFAPGETCVVARLAIDFLAELHYPGVLDIGLCVRSIGHSSFRLGEAVFSGATCAATAEVVMVMLDIATRKAMPLTPRLRIWLDQVAARQSGA